MSVDKNLIKEFKEDLHITIKVIYEDLKPLYVKVDNLRSYGSQEYYEAVTIRKMHFNTVVATVYEPLIRRYMTKMLGSVDERITDACNEALHITLRNVIWFASEGEELTMLVDDLTTLVFSKLRNEKSNKEKK